MPINPGDTLITLQLARDADGELRLKYDGRNLPIPISSTSLTPADKRAVSAAAALLVSGGFRDRIKVLVQGSDDGSGCPVQDTIANLANAD